MGVEVGQEFPRDPGVLGRHHRDRLQQRGRAGGKIAKVAERGGDDVEGAGAPYHVTFQGRRSK